MEILEAPPALLQDSRGPLGNPMESSFLPICCPGRVLRLDSVCLRPARAGHTRVLTPQMDSPSGWDRMQFLHQPWLPVGAGRAGEGVPCERYPGLQSQSSESPGQTSESWST